MGSARSLSFGITVPGNFTTTQAEEKLKRSFEQERSAPTGVGVSEVVRRAFGRSSVANRNMAELEVHDDSGAAVCRLLNVRPVAEVA